MPQPFRRFENLLRLLTTLVLTISALGLLLMPDRMGALTKGMSVIQFLLLGFGIYAVGLINQASIFITHDKFPQQIIDAITTACLAVLSYYYFRSGLVFDGFSLAGLVCAHLYLKVFRIYEDGAERNTFILGFTGLSLFNSFLLLFGLFDPLAYEVLGSIHVYVGIVFFVSSIAGLASFFLFPKEISRTLSKLIAVPWMVWVLIFALSSQFNTAVIAFSFAVLPLLTDLGSWNKLRLPPEDLIGRKVVRIASVAELLMVISLVFIGYSTQNSFFKNATLINSNFSSVNQDFSFVVMLIAQGFTLYGLMIIVLTVNRLKAEWSNPDFDEKEYVKSPFNSWSRWITTSVSSLASPSRSLQTKVEIQSEQISSLTHQLQNEKKRSAQLNLLAELSHQLEAQLDQPVAAQLAVNTLQRALDCKHVAVYENEIERREFSIMACGGTYLPPGYRQGTSHGILGRAFRLRKTQIANDIQLDPDLMNQESSQIQSIFAVPLIYHGHVKAILEVGDDKTNAFSSHDVHLAELIATELIRAWERSSYHQRLTDLIKAGISLSPLLESHTTIKEIATIARETLEARFTFVTLLDQEGNFSRTAFSGQAPRLLNSLNQNPVDDTTIQAALHAYEPFRIRDVRKYRKASHIEIDHHGLRSLLAIPIRLHRLSIGAILAFGKQGEIFFSENDESLAGLLSSQAATAIEATWLYQELRNTLSTTTQLYNLSVKIIQAEELQQAARHIAETASKVANATTAGIVLFTKDKHIEAEVEIDENGAHPGLQHPMDLIQQTLESGQIVHITPDQISATICFPLQKLSRKYGALWLSVPNIREYFSHHASNMQTLANQAILALERSILLVESQKQAEAIESAYEELEFTYDRTLAALMSALDARDRETEGHSTRVSDLACLLSVELGLTASVMKAIERGSLLHDIGKIGISDAILHKPSPLTKEEWKAMRLHPDIGARIIEDIPFLQDTLPIIRYHHERWDGSGYPVGLSGKDIPLQARIFAVADAFDALISDRPYRNRISVVEALAYLKEQAGILFDPEMVSAFERMWEKNKLEELIS
jgi:HD-GYP domain-containing protein (c-di-GMP phosphodiesterase class II)/transcriptional regulator with GAF, ATPase, and Fis domain